jgi:hypothetical protein
VKIQTLEAIVAFGHASGLKIVAALVVPEEYGVVALVRTGQVHQVVVSAAVLSHRQPALCDKGTSNNSGSVAAGVE